VRRTLESLFLADYFEVHVKSPVSVFVDLCLADLEHPVVGGTWLIQQCSFGLHGLSDIYNWLHDFLVCLALRRFLLLFELELLDVVCVNAEQQLLV